jgi:hypothetical protein
LQSARCMTRAILIVVILVIALAFIFAARAMIHRR